MTWVRRPAGLTDESREKTLIPADVGLRRTGLKRVEVVPDDADRGNFLGDELLDDGDLRLSGRLVGGAKDGLKLCSSMPALKPAICFSP